MAPRAQNQAREARLFRNNRSQAVRIPAEFEFPGDRVLIHRDGDRLVIEPFPQARSIREMLEKWRNEPELGPEDQFPDDIRSGLLPLKDIEL